MDWWHVALDIRPTVGTSSGASKTSGSRSPAGTDLFSIDLAAHKPAAAPLKQAPAPAKRASDPKPASLPGGSDTASRTSSSSDQATAAASNKDAHSTSDKSSDDPDSSGSAADSGTPVASPKPRAATRISGKSVAAKSQPVQGQDPDPTTDASNSSGSSLLQLLAQSLEGGDSAASAPEPAIDDSTSATAAPADKRGDPANGDPDAQALALITQAIAAVFGASTASPQPTTANAPPSATDETAPRVADAAQSKRGAQGQELISILAQDVASDATVKSDAAAPQTGAPETRSAAAQPDSNSVTPGPDALARLGVGSHFSVQHAQAPAAAGELKSPVGSATWNDELGGQLTWMAQKGLETGSLRVAPEHLGPVEVKISVQNGDASVWFGATHPDTRAALEQALPRLREMFASQGMTLTDSGVSKESPRNAARNSSSQAITAVSAPEGVNEPSAVRIGLGLVDTYA